MKKIQRASRILQILFKTLCWSVPLVTAYLILFNIDAMINYQWFPLMIAATQNSIHDTMHYSFLHRLIILAIQSLPLSITVVIFNKLANLFGLYKKGKLFEEENIKLIKSISIYMISGELIQLVYQPLLTAALSFNNPAGERFASITLGTANASTLITACIILIASWILAEAQQLKTDSQLTI